MAHKLKVLNRSQTVDINNSNHTGPFNDPAQAYD